MPIPESQLETWCRQGATAPSANTYNSVKTVILDRNAPFAVRAPEVFLQGSYGNDTNVARDSDVNIVAYTDNVFFHNVQSLPSDQIAVFNSHFSSATYSYSGYKSEITNWLRQHYGSGVRSGNKAIYIPAGSNRRECDVLPAFQYRLYSEFRLSQRANWQGGICFFLPDGTQIINFPKQHSDNCTRKHQATSGWFKPTVRIYKNMRNLMVDRGLLPDGTAPSYFIEGMLYNVPMENFRNNWSDTFVATYNYCLNSDRTSFYCANDIHRLLGSSHTSWRADHCEKFLAALRQLWNDWRG